MTAKQILEKNEKEIHEHYESILDKELVDNTVKWWNRKLLSAMQQASKVVMIIRGKAEFNDYLKGWNDNSKEQKKLYNKFYG